MERLYNSGTLHIVEALCDMYETLYHDGPYFSYFISLCFGNEILDYLRNMVFLVAELVHAGWPTAGYINGSFSGHKAVLLFDFMIVICDVRSC